MIEVRLIGNETHDMLAALRHSWLTNQIIALDPISVGRWSQRDPENEVRRSFQAMIEPAGTFNANIATLKKALPNVADSFSPSSVFREGCLSQLSDGFRNKLGDQLDQLYFEEVDPEAIVEYISESLRRFEQLLQNLQVEWFLPSPTETSVIERFRRVQDCGSELLDYLRRLPRGIVLP